MALIQIYDHNDQYVLECAHHPNTNGLKLGKTQRAILDHLATGPGGFTQYSVRGDDYRQVGNQYREAHNYTPDADLLWHGLPKGIRVGSIASVAYSTQEPTASQIRVVQRNARRLEELGLVDCWHGCAGYVDRPYRCVNGEDYVMPQAVAALYVALRWDCEHLAEQDHLVAEWHAAMKARVDELFAQGPMTALRGLL